VDQAGASYAGAIELSGKNEVTAHFSSARLAYFLLLPITCLAVDKALTASGRFGRLERAREAYAATLVCEMAREMWPRDSTGSPSCPVSGVAGGLEQVKEGIRGAARGGKYRIAG